MKNISISEFIKRIIILIAGLTIAHLGVTLFLLSSLGSDPFNVLIQGISNMTPLSHGTCHQIVCFLIIGILLLVDRSYIKTGTFICMFLGGPIIDLFTIVLDNLVNSSSPIVLRSVCLVLGCFILAFGMTIVIKSNAGTGPNDLVGVVISDKLKISFGICRVVADFSFVIIGILLGGIFGVGTLVCAFLIGPIANHFLPVSEKIINKILKIK